MVGGSPAGGRRLRVAHLTTVDMSLEWLLATELAFDVEQGFEVFGISAPGPHVAAVEALGVTHVPVPSFSRSWNLRLDAGAARELWGLLRRLRLDVLHTHTPKAGVLGRVLGRAARVPVVVDTCHGLWVREGGPWAKRAVVLGIEGVASRFAHYELYQNDDDRRALRRFVPGTRSRTVGNGVDLARFRFDQAGRDAVRAAWGVAPGDLLVGGVGRVVAEKGVSELAEAARALAGRARFVWVGPDDAGGVPSAAPGRPRSLADVTGLDLVGPRADMEVVYSAFDVFALPSYREGFSRSAMEAAACGRPMVLSDIRGCREIGRHDVDLLMVPPRDAGALTTALDRLLDDGPLRDRLGASAARRAQDQFDQRRVAAASVETYRLVAARRGLGWDAA